MMSMIPTVPSSKAAMVALANTSLNQLLDGSVVSLPFYKKKLKNGFGGPVQMNRSSLDAPYPLCAGSTHTPHWAVLREILLSNLPAHVRMCSQNSAAGKRGTGCS
eukprot:3085430-Amphidinium_carterae.1